MNPFEQLGDQNEHHPGGHVTVYITRICIDYL